MDTLQQKLASPELGDRLSAVSALRDLPAAEAVPLLKQAIEDSNARVRYAAASIIGQKGDASVYTLLQNLLKTDPEFDVRASAAAALGDLRVPDAYEDLIDAYQHDGEWLVRFSCIAALGELADRRGYELLVTALQADPLIRTVAAGALGQLGDARAVPVLIEYLQDEDWQLRFRIAQALGELGGEEALAALEVLSTDPSEPVSSTARAALEQLQK